MPESIQLSVLGPGVEGRSKSIVAQKRQNLFLEIKAEKDKSNLVAYGTPGLKLISSLGNEPVRGIWWWEARNALFAVAYNQLYQVYSNGTFVSKGTLKTTTGNVSIADNGLQLMIVDGQNGYIFQPETGELTYNFPDYILRSYTVDATTHVVTVVEPQGYVSLYRYVGQNITFITVSGDVPSGTYTITSVLGNTWTFAAASGTINGTANVNNDRAILVNETLTSRKTGQQVKVQRITGDLPVNPILGTATYTVQVPETSAPYLINGVQYVIKDVANSDFTLVGASLNQSGIVFTANVPTVTAGNFVVGKTYTIGFVGTTNFTTIGSSSNVIGTTFIATGVGTGTGYAYQSASGLGVVTDADDWLISYQDPWPATSGTLKVIDNFRSITSSYTGVNFPVANTVVFIDSYFVINVPNTKQFWLSGQYDGFNWDPLQFASKEAYTDDLQAVFVDNGNLVLLGTISQEYWQNTGSFPFPFQRIAGSPTDIGLAARWSVARCAGEMFYLGRTRRGGISVIRIQNYQPVIVSTPDLDYLFSQYQNVGDAIAFGYRQNGHEFYQISFQKEGKTWLFDATTDAWSELVSGRQTRHYANFGAQYLNQIAVTDYRNGNIYILDPQTYTDNGELIARELITPHLFADTSFNKLHVYRLRLDMQQGVGVIGGNAGEIYINTQNSEIIESQSENLLITEESGLSQRSIQPQIMLQVSRDGGYTYGREMWTSFGAIGQYLRRAEWRRLGVSRSFVFKFRVTDPVKVVIISAAAYATMAAK